MRKRSLLLVLVCLLIMSAGCSWFVPGAIKREVSLVEVDLKVAVDEVEKLEGDEAKQKAMRTFKRVIPHVENVNRYIQGKKAQHDD